MSADETKLSIACQAVRPRSVEMTSPQPEAVVADLTDPTPLEIALGITEPLPWPQSIADEIALAESRLADPLRDKAPATRPKGKVNRIMRILDNLESSNRRCPR